MKIGSMEWKRLLCDGAAAMGVSVGSHEAGLISIYALELMAWNRKMNLTAISDPLEIAVKHFLDSMACIPFLPGIGKILDIGTGGGFPGIPVKILIPALHVTLVDSIRKKTTFLKHVIRTLKLDGVDVLHNRVESLSGREGMADGFDAILCRALFPLEELFEKSLPLLRKNGIIISWKAKPDPDELRDIQQKAAIRGFEIRLNPYTLPFLDLNRTLARCYRSNSDLQ
ncbi:MAG: 16S rRNA (guanine(527)-N(7))-methyltransferase RsmG [Thermodesulfobacteriota bacterium]